MSDYNPNELIGKNEILVTFYDEDGNEFEQIFPAKMEVCSRCEGYGTHLHPEIGKKAYTMEEFNDEFDDEMQDQYFKRGGNYDVRCEECNGEKVVKVIDEDRVNANKDLKAIFERYTEWLEEDGESEANWVSEQKWERRMLGEY